MSDFLVVLNHLADLENWNTNEIIAASNLELVLGHFHLGVLALVWSNLGNHSHENWWRGTASAQAQSYQEFTR